MPLLMMPFLMVPLPPLHLWRQTAINMNTFMGGAEKNKELYPPVKVFGTIVPWAAALAQTHPQSGLRQIRTGKHCLVLSAI